MSRVSIDADAQDRLFAIFDAAQGLQRRTVRMIARGYFNEHAVDELTAQAKGIADDIQELAAQANPNP